MSIGAIGLAFLAGMFSMLSPCVLPLLPLVLGAAAPGTGSARPYWRLASRSPSWPSGCSSRRSASRSGSTIPCFRFGSAILMILFGIVLVAPPLQERFSAAAGPLSDKIDSAFRGYPAAGALGQFGLGLVLGAVWSPCVGPTLGAASVLAARGENLQQVAVTMAVFGLGAALPLLLLGALSRRLMSSWRDLLLGAGKRVKQALGVLLIVLGALIVSGVDKDLEAALVAASPAWLTRLTTRF